MKLLRDMGWPWIGDMFDGRKIAFPDKSVWEIENNLSEASQQIHPPSEARAVYVCKQIAGSQVGSQAIIKVRMQYVFLLVEPSGSELILHIRIPETQMPHPNPRERAKY